MLCLYPLKVKGREVPCGQCRYCRENHRNEIAVRAALENRMHDKSVFLTLTYAPEWLPEDNSVHKRTMQLFKKRLSKATGKKLRFVASGEYGSEYKRPHYHLLVFGLSKDDPVFYNWKGRSCYCKVWNDVKTGKPLGFCYVGNVSIESCRYVAKYVCKKLTGEQAKVYSEQGIEPEFCLLPRRPGLGFDYLQKNQDILANKGYTMFKDKKFALPRYFKDKLDLWIDGFAHKKNLESFTRKVAHKKDMEKVKSDYGWQGIEDYEKTRWANAAAKAKLFERKGVLDG